LLFRCKFLILHLSRMRRNVNWKDYNDRENVSATTSTVRARRPRGVAPTQQWRRRYYDGCDVESPWRPERRPWLGRHGRRHTPCTAVCRRVPVCACAVDAMSGSAASDAIIQCILLNNASVGRHWPGPCRSTLPRPGPSLAVNATVPTIVLIRRTRRPWVSRTSAAVTPPRPQREQIWRRLNQNESGTCRRSWGRGYTSWSNPYESSTLITVSFEIWKNYFYVK